MTRTGLEALVRRSVVMTAVVVGSLWPVGCSPKAGARGQAVEKVWHPRASQLLPDDVQWACHIPGRFLRSQQMCWDTRVVMGWAGLSQTMLDLVLDCRRPPSDVWMGGRWGPRGLDGDVLAVLAVERNALGARLRDLRERGWVDSKGPRGERMLAPRKVTDRGKVAMFVAAPPSLLVAVSPGMLDAWQRLEMEGPSAPRHGEPQVLQFVATGPVSLETERRESGSVPWEGIVGASVLVRGWRPPKGEADVEFGDEERAARAGDWLAKLRERGLTGAGKGFDFRRLHAWLRGSHLLLEWGADSGDDAHRGTKKRSR